MVCLMKRDFRSLQVNVDLGIQLCISLNKADVNCHSFTNKLIINKHYLQIERAMAFKSKPLPGADKEWNACDGWGNLLQFNRNSLFEYRVVKGRWKIEFMKDPCNSGCRKKQ